tara:strand:- start:489 stop:1418 length:930 start_codon:yes stop_codon:yes gene_type:complete
MYLCETTREILSWYEGDSPGVKRNIASFLTQGKLANTGKLLIYPVDQGFEHGPVRSFSTNPEAFDPHYHYSLAIEAGLSGYAAPLGMLEAGADTFAGAIPTILKMNSGNTMTRLGSTPLESDQAITASVNDALRLGCSAIGFTIYPGSDKTYDLFEEIQSLSGEARSRGLAVVIWSYPRGNISKAGETALDVVAYATHMAALLGAHIIKVKLPSDTVEYDASKREYSAYKTDFSDLAERVAHIRQCAFNGRRLLIFSGGEAKDRESVLNDARAIKKGGGHGSIMGRNAFQRPRAEALQLLSDMIDIYRS